MRLWSPVVNPVRLVAHTGDRSFPVHVRTRGKETAVGNEFTRIVVFVCLVFQGDLSSQEVSNAQRKNNVLRMWGECTGLYS